MRRLKSFALAAIIPAIGAAQTSKPAPLGDAAVQRRANDLLKRMTAEEKIGQLSQLFALGPAAALEKEIRAGRLGSVLFVMDPAETNRLQRLAVEGSRLRIPLLFGFDVVHGFRTIFPAPIAMAASWDAAMVERAQAIAAREARAAGIHWTFAPMLDIARDPRWGRIVEGPGEDPYLASAMAAAQVRGFQGTHIGAPESLVACPKHFAGYGAAEGGRDYDAAYLSDDQLWNVYLPPFHSAVKAGAGTVMSAYMDLNGVPATGNPWLLRDVLRNQWGFRGFVVSDANSVKNLSIQHFAKDEADAAMRAFQAGVNMEMGFGGTAYGAHLPAALKQGRITLQQLDDAVRPILETKIRLGLFENPYIDEAAAKRTLEAADHRAEALRAAERSAVLLRNEAGLLPLNASAYQSIAVLGPLADSKRDILGSWVFAHHLDESVTVLEGLRQAAPGVRIQYAPAVQMARKFPSMFDQFFKVDRPAPWTEEQADREFARAVQLARQSDLTVLVLGEAQDMSGESASRSSLDLPGRQQQLLEAVAATKKPVVLVLLSGRPLNIVWAAQHVPAILLAWYPGTQGGRAVANLLYGRAAPGGKLPFTWPRSAGHVPAHYSHTTTHAPADQSKRYWEEESTPLYPFGYGLSYAAFRFSNLQVSRPKLPAGQSLTVSVDVENASGAAGEEVVQLYIHQRFGTSSRPVRELKGFRRITLAPREKRTVQFTLGKDELTYWSAATRSWVQDAALFDVWVGGDSAASLHSAFEVVR